LRELFIIEPSGQPFDLINPNEKDLGKSLWLLLLSKIDDLAIWQPGFWKKVEVFLEYGADPPQWQLSQPIDESVSKDESDLEYELAYEDKSASKRPVVTLIIGEHQQIISVTSSDLYLLIRHGKPVTLRITG